MTVVKNVVYRSGEKLAEPTSLEESHSLLDGDSTLVWIGLLDPGASELQSIADIFSISSHAIEDACEPHHRPKIKRYGDTLLTTLLSARYIDVDESVEFSELYVFTGLDFVITIRKSEMPDLVRVRRHVERVSQELELGPEAILYAILRQVMDEYAPVIAGVENDLDEIEDQLFSGDASVARRVFDLSREIIAFQRATHPLESILNGLKTGYDKYHLDSELLYELKEIQGYATRIIEQVDSLRFVVHNAISVQAILANQQQNSEMQGLTEAGYSQNEEVKKISAWAAILFAPSLVGTVYGMNFKNMPLLDSRYGFAISLVMMLGTSLAIYVIFKRKRWL